MIKNQILEIRFFFLSFSFLLEMVSFWNAMRKNNIEWLQNWVRTSFLFSHCWGFGQHYWIYSFFHLSYLCLSGTFPILWKFPTCWDSPVQDRNQGTCFPGLPCNWGTRKWPRHTLTDFNDKKIRQGRIKPRIHFIGKGQGAWKWNTKLSERQRIWNVRGFHSSVSGHCFWWEPRDKCPAIKGLYLWLLGNMILVFFLSTETRSLILEYSIISYSI